MRIVRNQLFNIRAIANLIGKVLFIEGVALAITLLVCLVYGEPDWSTFLVSAAAAGVPGALMGFCIKIRSSSISSHDGILITALAWIVIALFGSLPFMMCDHPVSFSDAFFESMSGFTTTGASVIANVENLSHGMNMWRALTQWIGGLGIILFTLTLIPMLNKTGGMRLMAAESSDFAFDKTSPRIMQTARTLGRLYLVLTVCCVLLLWCGPMDLYDAVVHSFSTLSTGGFSPYSNGVMHFSSVYVKLVISLFMFLGATNFTLMAFASKGNFRPLVSSSTFWIFILTILVFTGLFIGSMLLSGCPFSFESMVLDPLFQVISAITSTGYASADYEAWGSLVFILLLVLMYSGACIGSTSGGAKLDRVIVFLRNSRNEISSTINSNTVYSVHDGNKNLNSSSVGRIVTFLGIYAVTLIVGSLLLLAFGIKAGDSFFAVFSCTSNVGLGYGLTGFDGGFVLLPTEAKWVLSFMMYIGRLELLTVFVLLMPSFWRR